VYEYYVEKQERFCRYIWTTSARQRKQFNRSCCSQMSKWCFSDLRIY